MLVIVLLQNTIMTKLYLPFQGTFINLPEPYAA